MSGQKKNPWTCSKYFKLLQFLMINEDTEVARIHWQNNRPGEIDPSQTECRRRPAGSGAAAGTAAAARFGTAGEPRGAAPEQEPAAAPGARAGQWRGFLPPRRLLRAPRDPRIHPPAAGSPGPAAPPHPPAPSRLPLPPPLPPARRLRRRRRRRRHPHHPPPRRPPRWSRTSRNRPPPGTRDKPPWEREGTAKGKRKRRWGRPPARHNARARGGGTKERKSGGTPRPLPAAPLPIGRRPCRRAVPAPARSSLSGGSGVSLGFAPAEKKGRKRNSALFHPARRWAAVRGPGQAMNTHQAGNKLLE